jgi:hypothetical protein
MMRSSTEVLHTRATLRTEMAGGDLGDARLNARRNRLITVLEQHPDEGFPTACGSASDLEALYRFLRNPQVSLEKILAPHVVATCERCRALGEVLVIHDTTEQSFAGNEPRAGLTPQGRQRQGFWLHAALAVSADGLQAPLGVLGLMPFVRPARRSASARKSWRQRWTDPDKESHRWAAGVAAVRTRFREGIAAIHLMDREGDSYELFAALLQHGDRFVVRLTHDRRVVPDGPGAPAKLSETLLRTAHVFERQVMLSPRQGSRQPHSRKLHPPRAGRMATVRFAAQRVQLQRPHDAPQNSPWPPTLAVHVVYGWEGAPPPGEPGVEWRLVTTEPIDTVEQVQRIVDSYRTRWLIEDFFKALKTGCAYEKRQLESLHTLLVALALLAPIAWQLLLVRHLARHLPDVPATVALTSRQLQVLCASPAGDMLPATPTIRDALCAVARLGGHLRQNGEPGWLVLTRGMQKLRDMEAGWAAAERARRM